MFATKELIKERMDICKACPHYFKATTTCKKCGCFMKVKTALANVECADKENVRWGKAKDTQAEHPSIEEMYYHYKSEILWIGERFDDPVHMRSVSFKQRTVDIYNLIYKGKHDRNTTCSSCLTEVKKGIRKAYEFFRHDKEEA